MMSYSNRTPTQLSAISRDHARKIVAGAKEDNTLVARLQSDPHTVLGQIGLVVPSDRRIHVVDESAGDVVFRLPAAASRAKERPQFKESAPAAEAAAWIEAVGSTIHHITGSIWPVGYKGNDRFDFRVPDGSSVTDIQLLADETAGQGARMLSRPDNGSGPGSYSVRVHWWINAYQETYYSLIVRISPNANNKGGYQLGDRYEISGFMHTSTNWEPIVPEAGHGHDSQILWTQLE